MTSTFSNDVWDTFMVDDVSERHCIMDENGVYYIPAPTDLFIGDFIVVDGVKYEHTDDKQQFYDIHIPLEDKRFIHLPVFTWRFHDCNVDTFMGIVTNGAFSSLDNFRSR